MDQEVAKHKKKKPSSKSASIKRSDHKHKYEKVIIFGLFGFYWGERCTKCGRIGKTTYAWDDFLKPEYVGSASISIKKQMSVPEIRKKYPGIDIYKLIDFGIYKLIEDDI